MSSPSGWRLRRSSSRPSPRERPAQALGVRRHQGPRHPLGPRPRRPCTRRPGSAGRARSTRGRRRPPPGLRVVRQPPVAADSAARRDATAVDRCVGASAPGWPHLLGRAVPSNLRSSHPAAPPPPTGLKRSNPPSPPLVAVLQLPQHLLALRRGTCRPLPSPSPPPSAAVTAVDPPARMTPNTAGGSGMAPPHDPPPAPTTLERPRSIDSPDPEGSTLLRSQRPMALHAQVAPLAGRSFPAPRARGSRRPASMPAPPPPVPGPSGSPPGPRTRRPRRSTTARPGPAAATSTVRSAMADARSPS